jgi:MFS family permease
LEENIKVLYVVGLSHAFVMGLFEFIFPFFLTDMGISLVEIGIIFSVSALALGIFRILLGEYTDIYGRKRIYSTAFALGALSNLLYPLSLGQIRMALNKILTDISASIRMSVHSIMLYESDSKNYNRWYSWLMGGQHIVMAFAIFISSLLLFHIGYSNCFFLIASIQIGISIGFSLFYREKKKIRQAKKISLKAVYSFDIHRNLKVLVVASILLSIGFQINHTFTLPLYFAGKYGMPTEDVAIMMSIHRLGFLTTFFASNFLNKVPLKKAYIYASLAFAISFLIVGLITLPIAVFIPIWLLHDLLGGGIWVTAREAILQKFARDETRGKDVNTFGAIHSLTTVITPSLAGALAAANWDYIFLGGGILCLASVILFYVFYEDPSHHEEEATI